MVYLCMYQYTYIDICIHVHRCSAVACGPRRAPVDPRISETSAQNLRNQPPESQRPALGGPSENSCRVPLRPA